MADEDRRRSAEALWRLALREHEDDRYAHGAQRHDLRDEIGLLLARLEVRVIALEGLQRQAELERRELKGILKVLRWEVAGFGFLITAFGGFAAFKIWGG